MPHHTGMSPKQKRIVERDVKTLFSSRAFLGAPTFEELKHLPPFHPYVEYNGETRFLSEKGMDALRRLIDLLSGLPELVNSVSAREIDTQILQSYKIWLKNSSSPTSQEFIEAVVNSLREQVKHYEFLVQIEGIDIKDQDILHLGSIRVQRSDPALFENVKFGGLLDRQEIYSEFKDCLWLIGSSKGSADVASEQFEYRAVLTVGILAVCGALLYKGAIWRSHVRTVTCPLEHRRAVSSLRWEVGGENPWLLRNGGAEQNLPLSSKSVTQLTNNYFLEQLSALPDRRDRSELEDAIVRSLYWFAESYRDRNPVMQFLKLWTCAECFFTIDKEQITELNAKGITAVLTFGGYNVVPPKEYLEFKRRIKKLYALRSKAFHRAEFGHINRADLDDLSYWIAWVVISMVALTERGYQTLRQVHEKTSHLDQVSSGLRA